MMKSLSKIQLLLFALVAVLFAACQSEENEVIEPNPENLTASSPMTALLRRVSMEDVFSDNSIDSTACYKLKLPVDVIVNGQQNTIATVDDYPIVTAILNGSNSDIDSIEFVFPITVIATNGTEILVTSQSQFDALTENCQEPIENQEPINCIGINYPVTIFKYDPNFQISGTSIISNDADLLLLLMNLSVADYYAISYPISVTTADGQIVEINNNQELKSAIESAVLECNPVIDPCDNPNILIDKLIIYMPFANEARDLVSMNFVTNNDNYPPLFVADRNGTANSALSFSGNEFDVLTLAETNQNHLKQGDSITVSVWFKQQLIDSTGPDVFFEKSNNCFCDSGFIVGYMVAPFFGQSSGGILDTAWANDPNLTNDAENWHHFVVTVTPENIVSLYRDGELRFSMTMPNLNIGEWFGNYVLGRNFKGYIDDLRVYRKNLNAQEVQILFNLEGDNNNCLY